MENGNTGIRFDRANLPSIIFWAAGLTLIVSGLVHIPLWYLRGDSWEGPLSLRKPILFGLATGITLWSFAWLVTQLKPRWWFIPVVIMGSLGALLEVGIISLQAWRLMPSHYSQGGSLESILYVLMEIGLAALCFSLCAFSWLSLWQQCYIKPPNEAKYLAILLGLMGLHAGLLTGVGMLIYGNHQMAINADPTLIPPAGVLKFLHGIPIHAPQLLWPLLWFTSRSPYAGQTSWFVGLISLGISFQTIYAAIQVFNGQARFDAHWSLLLFFVIGSSLITFPWIIVILGYMRSYTQFSGKRL